MALLHATRRSGLGGEVPPRRARPDNPALHPRQESDCCRLQVRRRIGDVNDEVVKVLQVIGFTIAFRRFASACVAEQIGAHLLGHAAFFERIAESMPQAVIEILI